MRTRGPCSRLAALFLVSGDLPRYPSVIRYEAPQSAGAPAEGSSSIGCSVIAWPESQSGEVSCAAIATCHCQSVHPWNRVFFGVSLGSLWSRLPFYWAVMNGQALISGVYGSTGAPPPCATDHKLTNNMHATASISENALSGASWSCLGAKGCASFVVSIPIPTSLPCYWRYVNHSNTILPAEATAADD